MTITDRPKRAGWSPFAPVDEAGAMPTVAGASAQQLVHDPVEMPDVPAAEAPFEADIPPDPEPEKTNSPLATGHSAPDASENEIAGRAGCESSETGHWPLENGHESGEFEPSLTVTDEAVEDAEVADEPVRAAPTLAGLVAPPLAQLFGGTPPSVGALIAYADTAPVTAATGPGRRMAVAYNRGVAVPAAATAYLAAWTVRHPTRAAFAAAAAALGAAAAVAVGVDLTVLAIAVGASWWAGIAVAATVIATQAEKPVN